MTYNKIAQKLARARFISVSLLIHLLLIVLAGSVIVTHSQRWAEIPFVSTDTSFLNNEEPEEPIAEPSEFEEPIPAQASPAPASAANSSAMVKLISTQGVNSVSVPVDVRAFSGNAVLPGVGTVGTGIGNGSNAGGRGIGSAGMRTTMFGTTESRKEALPGHLYDLKQAPDGSPSGITDFPAFWGEIRTLIDAKSKQFSSANLAKFFSAPTPLFASQWTFPNMDASEAPTAFGVQDRVQPKLWVAHYSGKISAKGAGTFRFAGYGDNVLMVAIDGKLVLDASRTDGEISSDWKSSEPADQPILTGGNVVIGDPVEFRAGVARKIDILIGETSGERFGAYLLVRRSGKKSDRLPFFATGQAKLPDSANEASVLPEAEIFLVD